MLAHALSCLVVCVITFVPVYAYPLGISTQLPGLDPSKSKLTFDSNGRFKVVSFSDMHFGERWGNGSWASWGPENDALTQVRDIFRSERL